jgi:hypothetical protein
VSARFGAVAALLRLGTKYDVPLLRRLALTKVRALAPATWAELGARRESHAIVADFENAMAPALLRLAAECALPAALPFAMWWAMPAGSDRANVRPLGAPAAIGDGRAYALPPATVHALLLGGWRVAERCMQAALRVFRPAPDCAAPAVCAPVLAGRLAASAIPRIMVREVLLRFKQLSVVRAGEGERPFAEQVCAQCYAAAAATWEEERKRNWDNLPSFFDLEPWDVLLAVSDAVAD